MLDGMPRCAVPCGIGSARKEYERGPDVQGKQEVALEWDYI
jgi:hypothetical protein